MKYIAKYIYIWLPLLFVSCTKGDIDVSLDSARLSLSETELQFDKGEGAKVIELVSARDWSYSSNADWVTVSSENTEGAEDPQMVTVSVKANSHDNREAVLRFTIGTNFRIIKIVQKGEVDVGISEIGDISEGTLCNTEGTVAGKNSSAFVVSDKGDNLLVTLQAGTDMPDIEIGDHVSISGIRCRYGKITCLSINDPESIVKKGHDDVTWPEPFTVNANSIGTLDRNICSFISFKGVLSLPGFSVEIDGVREKFHLWDPNVLGINVFNGAPAIYYGYYCGGDTNDVLVTTVKPLPNFAVDDARFEVNEKGGTISIPIKSNVEWTAVSDNEDFVLSEEQGSGDAVLIVTYSDNPAKDTRTAVIKVSTEEDVSDKEAYITIVQSGKLLNASVDILTSADFTSTGEAKEKNWKDFSGVVKVSGAVYAGQTGRDNANGNAIQIRFKNNSGAIFSTDSGGRIRKVIIHFSAAHNTNNQLLFYGSNKAFTDVASVYACTNQIGGLTGKGETVELNINDSYDFIGMRPSKGTVTIDKIEFVWEK